LHDANNTTSTLQCSFDFQTIEEFFRKEVTYLVTSRGDCGKSPSSQSAPSPGTPSPIPQTRRYNIGNKIPLNFLFLPVGSAA
jgi:hypothetical protein